MIADGKRGDIDVTAGAYADSLFGGLETPFGHVDGLGADLVTVNPLMGRDAIEPFVRAARERGAGVLLLVRTSNPGAADVEELRARRRRRGVGAARRARGRARREASATRASRDVGRCRARPRPATWRGRAS